jgi:hypothetical protein
MYNQMTAEFNATILAHIYGHTHSDEFEMIVDNASQEPVGVINVAPSVIPTYNPSLRIFEYDPSTKELLSILISNYSTSLSNWIFTNIM